MEKIISIVYGVMAFVALGSLPSLYYKVKRETVVKVAKPQSSLEEFTKKLFKK